MKRSVGILVVLALAACFQLPAFGQESTAAESQNEQRVRLALGDAPGLKRFLLSTTLTYFLRV